MCKAGGCARLRHAAMGRGGMQSTALHATGANPAMPPQPHWAPAVCSAGAGAAGFCQADGWWRVGLGAVGRRGARTGNANTFSAKYILPKTLTSQANASTLPPVGVLLTMKRRVG